MDGELKERVDVVGAWTCRSETEGLEWGWRRDEPTCQISRSKVILFKSYCPDTQSHPTDFSTWTTEMVVKNSSDAHVNTARLKLAWPGQTILGQQCVKPVAVRLG